MNNNKIKSNLIEVYNKLSKIDKTNYERETSEIKKKIEKIITSIDELEKESLKELTDSKNKENGKNVVIYGEVNSDYEFSKPKKRTKAYSWIHNPILKFFISPLFIFILLGIAIALLITLISM